MTTEVAALQSVQDGIKERIKAEFVGLIPDEVWSRLVGEVVSDFIEDKQDKHSRGVVSSPLKNIIRAELEALAKAQVKAELDKLGNNQWDGFGAQVAGEAMKELVAKHFTTILADMQAGMVSRCRRRSSDAKLSKMQAFGEL